MVDRSKWPSRGGEEAVPSPELAELRGIAHGGDVKKLQFDEAKKDILALPDSELIQLAPSELVKQRTLHEKVHRPRRPAVGAEHG